MQLKLATVVLHLMLEVLPEAVVVGVARAEGTRRLAAAGLALAVELEPVQAQPMHHRPPVATSFKLWKTATKKKQKVGNLAFGAKAWI